MLLVSSQMMLVKPSVILQSLEIISTNGIFYHRVAFVDNGSSTHRVIEAAPATVTSRRIASGFHRPMVAPPNELGGIPQRERFEPEGRSGGILTSPRGARECQLIHRGAGRPLVSSSCCEHAPRLLAERGSELI